MSKQKLKESETVELKKSLAELKQGLISMAAILNKHKAGTLWFGIRNNGAVSGIDAVFKDRVEIRNPGKLFGDLTIDDLRKGNVSKRRNPLIADLFRRIEMVEAWGRGIPLILEKEPDVKFREVATLFIASFGRPSFKNAGEVGKEKVQKTIQDKHEATKETLKKHQRNPKEKILAVLSAQPSISIREAAVQCEMSFHGIQHHINKLKKAGIIRHVGPTKAGRWEVLENPPDASDGSDADGTNHGLE